MNYHDACRYLDSLNFRGIKLGLDQTRRLMAALGDPQKGLTVVHVTGTNGKGSTCSLISSILTRAGITNGLYVSPHLQSFRERIQISGEMIAEEEVGPLVTAVRQAASSIGAEVTYFEFLTAMAFLHFRQQEVRAAVIEVGLGGRFDSTNVVDPAVTIITSVGVDHQKFLGATPRHIAREKAGIVKSGRPLVLGVTAPDLSEVIRREAAIKKAPVYQAGRDYHLRRIGSTASGELLAFQGDQGAYEKLEVGLIGERQVENGGAAIQAIHLLRPLGIVADDRAVREGLLGVRAPGRFELVRDDPPLILDGAHNPAAAEALCQALIERFGAGSVTLVFGAMVDKDYGAMLAALAPAAKRFIFYSPAVMRAQRAELLAAALPPPAMPWEVAEGFADLTARLAPINGPVCVTGSFYTVGELRGEWLGRRKG